MGEKTASHGVVSFADVAHQTLSFDRADESARLILELIDTSWVQRLRHIKQTGNTNLVYMFAEHSRFGHSLGVAYLAHLLMRSLERTAPDRVRPYRNAVAAAALLHDIGHLAPGSHLAERAWTRNGRGSHEIVTQRIIENDLQIKNILDSYSPTLAKDICRILTQDEELPPWTHAIISGGGWNADRGNWAIVDSAMCSVTYGRYNVSALLESFRISDDGRLVLRENRVDALTHFFVARDSMYRQVYQHRVLQAVDVLTLHIIKRLRDILAEVQDPAAQNELLHKKGIFCDSTMVAGLSSNDISNALPIETLFQMNENWWHYHTERWCNSEDEILSDLSSRYCNRKLFKTIRLQPLEEREDGREIDIEDEALVERARTCAARLGFDPQYYVTVVDSADQHRDKFEEPPLVLLENGGIVPVTTVEPLIAKLFERPTLIKRWLVVPQEVKENLGLSR